MSEEPAAPSPVAGAALRFVRLVAQVAAAPGAVAEHRTAVRALTKALKGQRFEFVLGEDGALRVDGNALAPEDSSDADAAALLAARLATYGVESLTLTEKSAEADVNELTRLLGAAPPTTDPIGHFAVRSATIDARGIPRRLKARERTGEVAPLVPTATPRSSASVARRPTPASMAAPVDVPKPDAAPPTAPAQEPSPAVTTPTAADAPEPVEGPASRAEQLTEAIDVPEVDDARIEALVRRIQATDVLPELEPLVNELAEAAELAFRTGEHVLMLNAITALVAIEFRQLERDASDDRRRVFVQPLRRLANPPILRQLAVLRHRLADDATLSARAQAVLYRFGTDGADALMDEYANVPTLEGRRTVIAALRGLRRTFDALHDWLRNGDEYDVREAIAVLGALGDERAVRMLGEVLRHGEPRVRRTVVSELDAVGGDGALDLLGLALDDESPLVRARATAALSRRGASALRHLVPRLDVEPDREVLYGTMHALATIGTPEAVAALVRCAKGESTHPQHRAAAYRLQASAALVVIRTPAAMAAVGLLREDRDREVREGSQRLVAQAARRTTSMRAVTE